MIRIGPIRIPYKTAIIAILVLAAVLRFAGLNWDDGYYLHPDERFMVMVTVDTSWPESVDQYFDSETSPLNPYNTRHGTFVYGTFPMFLTKAVSSLIDKDVYGETHLAGRAISAIADTGTVFLVAWIARRFFGRQAGILAGFLFACTVLHIQTAHYYTVDSISVFFATAAFATTVKGWDRRSFGWFAAAGLMIGLAGASKPNYLIALAFLALPVAETIRRHGWDGLVPWNSGGQSRFPILPAVSLAGLVAFWTFRIAQPYAFAGPSMWNIRLNPQWLDDLSYWRSAQSGLIDIKSSIQWVDRTPVVYILDNLVRWGMGPPLGIVALMGLAMLVIRLAGARTWPSWWMLGIGGWCISQLVLYGTNMAQAQRYLMPIYPFLVVLGAGLLVELARRLKGVSLLRYLGPILIAITVAYSLFYAVAFDSLFVKPLSRVQASEWIYDNVPAGSNLTSEYWDDALPMRLEGEDASQYTYITLDLYAYEGPGSNKLSTLIGQLNQADYIILSSNRIIDSVPRQPERYPMASHYYEMLLDGDLGFDLVADFSQKPELFGIALDDTNAEETLTVYEHPYVRIFRKTPRFDAHDVYNELAEALGDGGVNYLPGDPLGDQMLLSPEEQASFQAHGTWWTKFDPESLSNRFPVVWWYIAMQLMIVPVLPLCWLLFRRFPDHGYAVAKVFGLLAVTWVAWLLASLELVPFGPFSIALAWLLVLVVGVVLARQHLTDMTRAWLKRWRLLVATEALFLAAFAFAIWLRSLAPAFWQPTGSDQSPFWYAIFNAMTRSTTFPAYDPWFSGGKLHLANWGQMPWVLLTRLTSIVPDTAWNLTFAGIFALTCVTLWGAGMALVVRFGATRAQSACVALLIPIVTMLGGMLTLAHRAGTDTWSEGTTSGFTSRLGLPGEIAIGLWRLMNRQVQNEDALIATVTGIASSAGNPLAAIVAGNLDSVTTTLPIIAMAVAVAIAIVLTPTAPGHDQWPVSTTDLMRIILGGLLAGAMFAASTWGFLPIVGLIAIAIIARLLAIYGINHPWLLVRNSVLGIVVAATAGYIAFRPAISAITITQRDMRTGPVIELTEMFATYGVPLIVILPWIMIHAAPVLRSAHDEDRTGQFITATAVILALLAFAGAVALDNTLLFLLAALFLSFVAVSHVSRRPAYMMTLGLAILGCVLVVLRNRMPATADPFGANSARYLESITWMAFGIAMSAGVGWILFRLQSRHRPVMRFAGAAWLVVLALVIGAGLSWPAVTIRSLVTAQEDTSLTLDATAFMTNPSVNTTLDLAADHEAAQWMMQSLSGLPVLLEATTADSQFGGRISAMTGLPTVIGWSTPERMMRPGWTDLVTQRQNAVRTIFGSRGDFASIEPLLTQYGVRVIYIGSVERTLYPAPALEKFDAAVDAGDLAVIYKTDGVTMYYYGE